MSWARVSTEEVTARHGSQLTMSIWIPNQAQSREVPQNQKAAATLFQTASQLAEGHTSLIFHPPSRSLLSGNAYPVKL